MIKYQGLVFQKKELTILFLKRIFTLISNFIFKFFFVLNTLFFKGLAFSTISDGYMSTQFTNEMDFCFSNHKFISK